MTACLHNHRTINAQLGVKSGQTFFWAIGWMIGRFRVIGKNLMRPKDMTMAVSSALWRHKGWYSRIRIGRHATFHTGDGVDIFSHSNTNLATTS